MPMNNTDKLQQLLGLDKSNPLFEIYLNPDLPDELLIYFGFQLLETVVAKSFQEKLLLARLINAGYNKEILHRTFGYDVKTMKRWGTLLKSGSPDDILKIANGQGAVRKLTDDKSNFIFYLFENNHVAEGCHILSFIKNEYETVYREQISSESLRVLLKPRRDEMKKTSAVSTALVHPSVLRRGELEIREKTAEPLTDVSTDSEVENSTNWENRCENSAFSSLTVPEKSKYSPASRQPPKRGYPLTCDLIKEVFSCHHIGLLLARVFIDGISSDLGDVRDIVRQWICMILSGCRNIEQGQKLNYRALTLLVGDQIRSANQQRKILKKVADKKNVSLLFRKNIQLVDAGNGDTFLLDPHGVPYTGQLKTLLCWLGARHQTGKGYYLDLIHTPEGAPVFSTTDDNYYDLRQRFHSVIKEFRRILDGDKNRPLTIVVDRAIYDVGFMRESRCEDVHIITWEKNYRKGQWDDASKMPVQCFHIRKYRNSKEDSYIYSVSYIKRKWEKEPSFAQYVIQLEKPEKEPIELSVICTDFQRDSEKTLIPILTRWLQENDMSYLVTLGINFITSYDHTSYATIIDTVVDREIKNKKLAKLLAEKNKLKNQLGRKMLDRELYIARKENELEKYNRILSGKERRLKHDMGNKLIIKAIGKLKSKIKRIPRDMKKSLRNNDGKQQQLKEQITTLEKNILPLAPFVSRLETLIQQEYVKLNFMPKSFMDAVKIISRNIIYQLMTIFRPIWNNYRNDHVILRELLTSIGFIQTTEKHCYIKLTPSRIFAKREKQKILLFLFEISNIVNKKYQSDKIIIITLQDL